MDNCSTQRWSVVQTGISHSEILREDRDERRRDADGKGKRDKKMAARNAFWVACVVVATASVLHGEFIDLSHDHNFRTVMSPDNPKYRRQRIFDGDVQPGVYARFSSYSLGEHGGTHLDAPSHFTKGGHSLEQVPLEHTVAYGVMVDCSDETAQNPEYALTLDKLKSWEEKYGRIPDQAAVVCNFNWSHRFQDAFQYYNTRDIRNTDTFSFPHVSGEAGRWLLEQRDVHILALDTASPDLVKGDMPVHVNLLKNDRVIVENLKDPGRLPARGFRFFAAPVKFVGASGVQVRAFALTDEDEDKNKTKPSQGTQLKGYGMLVVVLLFSQLFPLF